jgi:hypothetical protein
VVGIHGSKSREERTRLALSCGIVVGRYDMISRKGQQTDIRLFCSDKGSASVYFMLAKRAISTLTGTA